MIVSNGSLEVVLGLWPRFVLAEVVWAMGTDSWVLSSQEVVPR